jgi:hypothetical protein
MSWTFNEAFGFGSNLLQYLTALPSIGAFFYAMAISSRQKEAAECQKEMVEIQLRLTEGEERSCFILPFRIMRGEISRAEILGLLGMVEMTPQKKGQRYSIKALSSPEFLEQVYRVKAGNGFTLEIPCTAEEIAQFNL